MTLVRVNETDSSGEFSILNLQMITRVECRNFEQEKHRATVFFSDGGNVVLTGVDADRTIRALEDFAGYPRF
jgi:hypothetical protein